MRIKGLFICLALLTGAGLYAQNAESDFKTDRQGTITKYAGWDAAVVIPAQIGGKPVIAIGNEAFAKSDLTSVVIPDTVKTIGESAFADNKLTSVTLGTNIVFGRRAFTNGANLFYDYVCNDRKAGTYTADPKARQEKQDGDFRYIETKYGAYITGYRGSSGNRLQIPDKVNGLAVKAIAGFRGISRVRIPDSVSYIADSAFESNKLTEITIPGSVTSIGDSAFSRNQLTSVTIPNSVTSIGNSAFSGNQLTSVTIPNSVTSIGNSAFSGNQLTSVTIPGSVTSIGYHAFNGNPLTSITIEANVALASSSLSSFDRHFDSFYNDNGKKAGTYTRENADSTQWTYMAR